ncbi:MAG TPA: hypothetical protein ENH91_04725 [Leeuwenhoekiella sp.]|nr:hypothetical protein [Leeuwenhoekiella sp.]
MKLYITLAFACLTGLNTLMCLAQEKTTKITERYNVNEAVNLLLDSQNTDVVFQDWNKDEVQIEAILETEGLTEEQIEQLKNAWRVEVQGNSTTISIKSAGNTGIGVPLNDLSGGNLDDIVSSSMAMLEPMMQTMIAPMLQSLRGGELPPEYYEKIDHVKFDYDAYRRDGEQYLNAYKKKIRTSFGDDYKQVMAQWEKQNAQKLKRGATNSLGAIPESPFGKRFNFNTNAYQKDKKNYIALLNKNLNTDVSVQEVDKWMEDVKRWSEDFKAAFGENMENWSAKIGTSMQGNMQSLGENMGTAIERWSAQMEQMAQAENGNFSKTVTRDANGNVIGTQVSFSSASRRPTALTGNIKRTIVVHMPREAKLDLNVRHGNIKISEAKNARINLSHGGFIAKTIDGDRTYLTVAYSPIDVDSWNYGTLQTNYVKRCVINSAENIKLNSRASNIVIKELGESAVIRGSFGELTIPKLDRDFKSINISLQNSELVLNLPDTAYNFSYNGTRSSLTYPKTIEAKIMRGYDSQMLNGFYKAKDAGGSVLISSKFSDVVVK